MWGACVLRMENWFNACGGTISSEHSAFLGGGRAHFYQRHGKNIVSIVFDEVRAIIQRTPLQCNAPRQAFQGRANRVTIYL